jgi:hypothetical protein
MINKELEIKIKIEGDIKHKYQSFCKKNNFVLSRRLRALIQMDMDSEGKIKLWK